MNYLIDENGFYCPSCKEKLDSILGSGVEFYLETGWLENLRKRAILKKLAKELKREKAKTPGELMELLRAQWSGEGFRLEGNVLTLFWNIDRRSSNGRLLNQESLLTKKPVLLRYGESARPREVTLHRMEDWGFVAKTKSGYRSFSWDKAHYIELAHGRKPELVKFELPGTRQLRCRNLGCLALTGERG